MANDPNDPKKPNPGLPWDESDESALASLLEGLQVKEEKPTPEEDDATSVGHPFMGLEPGREEDKTSLRPLREEDSTAPVAPPSVHSRQEAQEEDDATAIAAVPSFFPTSPSGSRLPLPPSLTGEGRGMRLPLPASLTPRAEPKTSLPHPPEQSHTPPYGYQVRLPLPPSLTGEAKVSPKVSEPAPEGEPTPTIRYAPVTGSRKALEPQGHLPSPPRQANKPISSPQERTVSAPPPVEAHRASLIESPAEDLFSHPPEAIQIPTAAPKAPAMTAPPEATQEVPAEALPPAKAPEPAPKAPEPASTAAKPPVASIKPPAPTAPKPPAPTLPKPGENKPATSGASAVLARLRASATQAKPASPVIPGAKPAENIKTPEPMPALSAKAPEPPPLETPPEPAPVAATPEPIATPQTPVAPEPAPEAPPILWPTESPSSPFVLKSETPSAVLKVEPPASPVLPRPSPTPIPPTPTPFVRSSPSGQSIPALVKPSSSPSGQMAPAVVTPLSSPSGQSIPALVVPTPAPSGPSIPALVKPAQPPVEPTPLVAQPQVPAAIEPPRPLAESPSIERAPQEIRLNSEEIEAIAPIKATPPPRPATPPPPPPRPATPPPTPRPIAAKPAVPEYQSSGGLQEDILDILKDEVSENLRSKAWQPQPTAIRRAPSLGADQLPPDGDIGEAPSAALASPFSIAPLDAARHDLDLLEAELAREHDPKRRSALAFEAGRIQDEILGESGARTWFEKALRAAPQNRLAARALRIVAEREGDLETAIDAIRKELVTTNNAAEQAVLHAEMAELWRRSPADTDLKRSHNEAEAKAALKRALELVPDDARALDAWMELNRSTKQWSTYGQAARNLATRADTRVLGPALLWELGTSEELNHQDLSLAEGAYLEAERAGEPAATLARERLALRRGEFGAAAMLAPEGARAAACLRAVYDQGYPVALAALSQAPASVVSVVAQGANSAVDYTAASPHLTTASAQGAALGIGSIVQPSAAGLQRSMALSNEARPLSLTLAAQSTPLDAAALLLPLLPSLRSVILERYARDDAGALSSYVEQFKLRPSWGDREELLRLSLLLRRHDVLFDLSGGSVEGFLADEVALRSLEFSEAARAQGSTPHALTLLEAAVRQANTGKPVSAGLRLIIAAQQSDGGARARAYLEAAQDLQGARAKAALFAHVAWYLEQQGDVHRAVDALIRSLELRPLHRPTREVALCLAGRVGDRSAYRALRAAELELYAPHNPRAAAAVSFELGVLREEEGDPVGASTHYAAAVDLWPAHVPALTALARLAALRGDLPSQAKLMAALYAQQQDPSVKAITLFGLGELYAGPLYDPEKGKSALQEAWRLSPSIARAVARALELLCARQGDIQTLAAIYQSALVHESPEKQTELRVRLAALATEHGAPEAAARFYYETLQQDPTHPLSLLGLSHVMLTAHRVADVRQIYQQGALTTQDPALRTAFESALLALSEEAPTPQDIGRFFSVAPQVPMAQRRAISITRAAQDFLEEAKIYAQLADLAEDPTSRARWKTREGEALLRLQNPHALHVFTEALTLQPSSLAALRGQEMLAQQHGDALRELQTLEHLGEVLADSKEAARALLQAADISTRLFPDGERARQALWNALKRDPKNLEAFAKLRATLSPTSQKDALTIKQVIEQRLAAAVGEERRHLLTELAGLCKERLNDPDGARMALRELTKPENTGYQLLADLAELEWQAKEHEAAANLYVRILRLPGLNAKQRRDAYWHSGLIYDEHLPDIKKAISSYQHVLSLGGMTEQEAALRLARLMVKNPAAEPTDRSKAADLLVRVATAEPDVKARLALHLRATRLWIDLGDLIQATSAAQRALTLDEHHVDTIELLADLYQRRGDDRGRQTHLNRAVLAFGQLLRQKPTELEPYQSLVKVFRLMGDQTRAVAAAVLYCAFGGTQTEVRSLAQPGDSWPVVAPEKLLEPANKERLQHAGAIQSFRTLLPMLADVAKRVFPTELYKHGVGAQDRVQSGPTLNIIQTIGKALGVPVATVYSQKLSPFVALVENTSPPSLILGTEMLALPPAGELRFVMARLLYLAGQGPLLAATLKPNDLKELLSGAALSLKIESKLPKNAKIEEIARLAAPALAKRDSTTVSSLVLESLRSGDFQPDEFALALKNEANRVAVLLTGPLRASLEALARIHGTRLPKPGEKVPEALSSSAELRDLVQFVLSEDFVRLRGK